MLRKVRYYNIVILIVLSIFSISCSSARLEDKGETLMWRVDDGKNSIYLLGSIHAASPDLYPIKPVILDAFDKSSALVVELKLGDVEPMKIMNKAIYKDTMTLEKAVSEENYKMFVDFFAKHNMPALVYNKFKPWFAVLTMVNLDMAEGGIEADLGIDMFFLDRADSLKMDVKEIETIDRQLQVFDSFEDNSESFIQYTLKEAEQTDEMVKEMLIAWKNGDIKTLEKQIMIDDADEGMKKIMYELIDKRNYEMAAKIEKYLQDSENKYFVIVGAGHLIGENGIINILAKNPKYRIKRF